MGRPSDNDNGRRIGIIYAFAHPEAGAAQQGEIEAAMSQAEAAPKVLIVEDHDANLLVVTTFLSAWGYEYDIARNGYQAVMNASVRR